MIVVSLKICQKFGSDHISFAHDRLFDHVPISQISPSVLSEIYGLRVTCLSCRSLISTDREFLSEYWTVTATLC